MESCLIPVESSPILADSCGFQQNLAIPAGMGGASRSTARVVGAFSIRHIRIMYVGNYLPWGLQPLTLLEFFKYCVWDNQLYLVQCSGPSAPCILNSAPCSLQLKICSMKSLSQIAFIAFCLEITLQTYMLFFAAGNFIYIRYSAQDLQPLTFLNPVHLYSFMISISLFCWQFYIY